MKYIFTFFLAVTAWQVLSQVGIGTNNPDNSAQLDVSATTKGILFPRMTSVQRTSIAAPAAGLYVWDTNTKSLWFFDGVVWVNTASEATFGDVKSGIQAVDHSGWILLDGRAVNTLTATQQAAAASLGLVGNIPNATNSYLVQNGGALGAVAGSNTVTLTQGNLPNVNFIGNTSTAGNHGHGGITGDAGGHNHTGTTETTGAHQHSGTTNGAGSHSHSLSRRGNEDQVAHDPSNARAGESSAATTDRNFQGSFSTSTDGNHTHTFTTGSVGDHAHNFTTNAISNHNHSINTDGDHSHTVSVASGGSATPVNIAPQSLTVNMFIYLGQ
jgi:hypothetical protein